MSPYIKRVAVLVTVSQFRNKISYEFRMNAIKHTNDSEVSESVISMNEVPGKSLISEDEWKKIAAMAKLTERECQACRFVFEGNTRKEVAANMGISTRTVRHYLESIHSKLCVNGRVGIVLRLVQLRDLLAEQSSQPGGGLSVPPQS